MALYTRKGDGGFTYVPRPGQEPLAMRKDDPRVAALGEIDEFNAHLGWCVSLAVKLDLDAAAGLLQRVQKDLFRIGATLVAMAADQAPAAPLEVTHAEEMEREIDGICAALPPLEHFVLPGGTELSAALHLARTAARRAERAIITGYLPRQSTPAEPASMPEPVALILRYVNRLSDLLFALARLANQDQGGGEVQWSRDF
jgi:cob(I)alamin adenosyltransferase